MYCVVIQSSNNFAVTEVIKCFTLSTVQAVLEKKDPDMDFGYLMNGDVPNVTNPENGNVYSFFKLQHSDCVLNDNQTANS